MFRLRSIRRKLFWSLALVMAMFGVQAFGGLTGLMSYRSLIQDLDHEFTNGPRTSEVLAAICAASEPLVWTGMESPKGRLVQQSELQLRLKRLQEILELYHRRLTSDPLPPDRRQVIDSFMWGIDADLNNLLAVDVPRLASSAQTAEAISKLQGGLLALQLKVVSIPRNRQGFESRLDSARSLYKSRFWMIAVATISAVVLFAGLIHCAYRWIFAPIRELHQGASRVAQGDFSYRVKIQGDDEMAQLADKFNQMTAHFEETRNDLDRQVRERTKQALRSERLAGVGFLSAGVAHEINNPLSAIAMAAESLEGRIQDAQAVGGLAADDLGVLSQYLGMIQREAFRCQQITQRLLNFARGHDAPRSLQDLAVIVGEVLDMVGHMSRFRGYDVVFDRSQAVYANVNGSEIKQVVLNLVANALESMSDTGRLEITITEQADEVLLSFKDNGCGMTPHVLENLFEPFFTSKASGRGTGLGLSITHRIVHDHGGRIEALSDGPGQGSTFRVHLPRRAAQKAAA